MAGKIVFAAPRHSEVLIFDAAGSDILARTALEGLPYAVLPTRGESFHLWPGLLVGMLRRLGLFDWRLVVRRKGRGVFGQLFKVYLLACIERVAPRVVVTWIDNSWLFHALSRAYPRAAFFAVQNGSRSVGCMTTNPPLRDPAGYVISMPDLFCFGRYDEDLHRRHGHRVDRFHKVGPLLGGYYLSRRTAPAAAPGHELCLVSQWRPELVEAREGSKVGASIEQVAAFAARYAEERRVSVCVAARTREPGEEAFYRGKFGARCAIVVPDSQTPSLAVYRAIDDSAVAVGFCSTALLESFGWGHKTLFCNLYRDAESYSPAPGPWSVEEPSYELFRERLDLLRAMPTAEYERAADEFRRYAVSYDPRNPAHVSLREAIETHLKAATPAPT